MKGLWLMKSEPHVYSYDDLVADGQTHWDGVRNYQARNMMRDEMKVGDFILYGFPLGAIPLLAHHQHHIIYRMRTLDVGSCWRGSVIDSHSRLYHHGL